MSGPCRCSRPSVLHSKLRRLETGPLQPRLRRHRDIAAYDTVAVYETAGARGATVVIPPARTANVSGHGPRSPARDRTITWVKTLGRRRWKKASGYHHQGQVENTFFRYKSIIGAGLRARSPAGQGSEVVLGCEILNRMTRPRPTSVVSHRPVRILSVGLVRARDDSCNNAHWQCQVDEYLVEFPPRHRDLVWRR